MRLIAAILILVSAAFPQNLDPILDATPFRLIGPSSPAGRVWHVVGVPSQPRTWYVTTAGGGVWKTTNDGTTLVPIFSDHSGSVGAVAIAPSDPNQVWVGTGEPASTRANSLGVGLFKSSDGGNTWQFAGLRDSEEISAIVVDPRDPNVVYVAALGHLWGRNLERGIFKTTDGGRHWQKVLFVADDTGFIDLQPDPKNPDVMYAAAWQRLRWGNGDMTESGPNSGIYKTSDAGEHWTRLTSGLPTDPMGKIQLAVAHNNSQIIYAAILTGQPLPKELRTHMSGGVFRSANGGQSWTRVNPLMTSYYYQKILTDPKDDNRVFMPVLTLKRSDDGGRTFVEHNMKHVHYDLHGMWIDPNDSNHIVLGGDGGMNTSFDGGRTWMQNVLPIAQFYEADVDDQDPYYVYAGMQDTGHWTGPSQTYDNEGITNHDWIKLRYNGDGMAIHADPRDPNVIFMVQEFGNTSRLDLHTWARTELQPKFEEMQKEIQRSRSGGPIYAVSELHPFRWDWTPPMILSEIRGQSLFFLLGANYVFRCLVGTRYHWARNAPLPGPPGYVRRRPEDGDIEFTGGYANRRCEVISPDLTAQQSRDKVAGDSDGYHSYGALFSIAQSPADSKVLWAGADDGPLWVARNGDSPIPRWARVDTNVCNAVKTSEQNPGDNWRELKSSCHITRGVVSRIEPSRTGAGTAYVVYDLHTLDDQTPYVFKTTDFGKTWTNLSGNLAQLGSGQAFTIREDPNNPRVLLLGAEFGLFASIDGGQTWSRWKSNLPMSPVRALVIHAREREAVVATFGRAIWIVDLRPLEQAADATGKPAFLFDPKPAVRYNIRYTYGATIEELNGDMFFRGENPPYGTTLYYSLAQAASGDVRLTISDAKGTVVRTLTGPGSAGVHRVQWDLETDAAKAQKPAAQTGGEPDLTLSEAQARRRVAPGRYTVALEAGGQKLTRAVEVRAEGDGVKRVETRK